MSRYLTITPAKDEERLLPSLIDSMAKQTVTPARWIIIDDGSTDATASIIDEAAERYSWIAPVHLPPKAVRAEGGESVVMSCLPREIWEQYDFIFRLDADLTFGPLLIEQLLTEFTRDSSLGIAGPRLYEFDGSNWIEMACPAFHTRGAAKMYSRLCFAAIGGLETGLGWDTIDEARAMMLGFRSRSFRHIHAFHHRPQGHAGGFWKSRVAAGRAAYQIGYSPLFVVARALRRSLDRPFIIGGILLLAGYLQGFWNAQRTCSPELVRFVRKQQLRRLFWMESQWR